MSSLVERLRGQASHGMHDGTGECHATACDVSKAADRIEELEALVACMRDECGQHMLAAVKLEAELAESRPATT